MTSIDNDGKIFEKIHPELTNEVIFGDKAYQRPDAKEVEEKQNLKVLTPVKKDKGQKYLRLTNNGYQPPSPGFVS